MWIVILCIPSVISISIPATVPASAAAVDKAQLSVSLEFFTFPDYTAITSTTNCLANLASLRGSPPAIRIGGTTQFESITFSTDCDIANSFLLEIERPMMLD